MKTRIALLLGFVLWTAACGEDAVGPEATELTAQESAELAAGMAAFGGQLIGASADMSSSYNSFAVSAALVPSQEPAADSIDFTIPAVTRSCPLGGQVTVNGTLQGEYDDSSGTLSATLTATHSNTDCAYDAGDDTVVTNGTGEIEATIERVDHEWSGEQTRTYQGEFDWAIGDDRSGHCTISLTVTLDPGAGTRTVTGTACGHPIDETRTLDSA